MVDSKENDKFDLGVKRVKYFYSLRDKGIVREKRSF